MPRALGKTGEQLAQDQADADRDVADIYKDDAPADTAPATTPAPEAPVTPSPETPAAPSAPTAPSASTPETPAAPPETAQPGGDLREALRLEREHGKKREETWNTEKQQFADQMRQMQERLAAYEQQQKALDDLFTPEPTPEQQQEQQFWQQVEQRAQQQVAPILQQQQQQMAQMRLAMSTTMSKMAHPDFDQVTGWTGDPSNPFNQQHPFGQYLASSKVLQEQISKSPNVGEALYQAARDFSLMRPGGMQAELEKERQKIFAEAQAAAEAKYKDLLAKMDTPQSAPGSIAALGGGGSAAAAIPDVDSFDPYHMTPEQDALFRQSFADMYADN